MTTEDPWAPRTASETADAEPRRRRYRPLFLAAVWLFAVGVVFTLAAAFLPLALGHDGPTWVYLGAILFTPLGFLLGLVFAIVGARPPRVDAAPSAGSDAR